ncbi:hypothetical protein DNH61_04420 [Paenibacillus sambharensis]|uniref:Uncharacterized protein n=1 Tax=Paenibacillus sambharensis TaxID=1803190 RepID=A0A2W1M077_9BACL|nr:hypothetical protein DNH61_04420 [Paenibacillus sambharensis]
MGLEGRRQKCSYIASIKVINWVNERGREALYINSNFRAGRGKKYILPTILLLITASWIGNIWYYESMQLDKPVFLKHYMILNGNQSDWIELTFLENKRDGKKVTGIKLEKLPQVRFEINPPNRNYRYQVIRKAYGSWNGEENPPMVREPLIITEATVYYSEGPPEKVPIGEIHIMWERSEGLLESVSSGGSSDGTGQYTVNVKEDLTLEQVDYSFSDRLSSLFEFNVITPDGPVTEMPIHLDAGDTLIFDYVWKIPAETAAAFEIYRANFLLSYTTGDGEIIHDRIPISFNRYLSEKQINWFARSGGELP